MLRQKTWAVLALRFALVFVLLVLPWPGFRESFAGLIRRELGLVLKAVVFQHEVRVCEARDAPHPSIDIRVLLRNPMGTAAEGQPLAREATFDSRSIGWMPHAMMLALVAATPVAWRRLWRILAAGLAGAHLLVLATFVVGVLNAVVDEHSPRWIYWGEQGLYHVLVENLWSSFVGPFLLWIACLLAFGDRPLATDDRRPQMARIS